MTVLSTVLIVTGLGLIVFALWPTVRRGSTTPTEPVDSNVAADDR